MDDQPGPVRADEGLPVRALEDYLRAHLDGFAGSLVVEQFPRGHSNLTYRVSDGTREWVLRRPPFGTEVATAHDMSREWRILRGLHRAFAPAPRALAFCDDESVIGAPFYVMERARGLIIRREPPRGLPFDPPRARAIAETLVDTLCALHATDLDAAGLAELGRPDGYIERQVRGWTKRYHDSVDRPDPRVVELTEWLAAHAPSDHPGVIIHNDFKLDNVVLDPTEPTLVRAVLDWEMATVGHPLMDLGTTLSYWVRPDDEAILREHRFGPTIAAGMPDTSEVARMYAERTGAPLDELPFFEAFGAFKTGVVVQQIYHRYARGHTRDARFAAFGALAEGFYRRAAARGKFP